MDTEEQASFRLATNGYRLNSALAVYSITHDDPEGWWEGNLIIDLWTGSLEELYDSLKAHGFPTHRDKILCPDCLNADVPDLGDRCEPCMRNVVAEYGH